MSIDTSVPGSAGWMVQQLSQRLTHPRRQRRFFLLDSYYQGAPPLPVGAENARASYQAFQRKARSNFAALIVDAPRSMLKVRAIRTAMTDDDNGDDLAWAYWRRNRLTVQMMSVWRWMLSLSEAYVSVGLSPDATAVDGSPMPVIAAEDPRQIITLDDPATHRAAAALKLFTDPISGTDYAYLWLPGELHVASRVRPSSSSTWLSKWGIPAFDGASWSWDDQLSAQWDTPVVPVVKFRNRDGVGEYEGHLDLLDRINHMLLQRMVIATLQAFRQRAVMVSSSDMPEKDEDGNPIDYDDILTADPGALWRLPETATLWESGQVDLTPILSSVRDDVLHLSAVTRTPLTMFTPDAATQTAEGAQLQREGLVFKVEDLQQLLDVLIAEVYSLAFTFTGHSERSQVDAISVDWRPAERYSLAERAAAMVQMTQAQMPWRTRMSDIGQFNPDEIDRMEAERHEDALFAAMTGEQQPGTKLAPTGAVADRLALSTDRRNSAVG